MPEPTPLMAECLLLTFRLALTDLPLLISPLLLIQVYIDTAFRIEGPLPFHCPRPLPDDLNALLSPGIHTLLPPSGFQLISSPCGISLRGDAGNPEAYMEAQERWSVEEALLGPSAGNTLTASVTITGSTNLMNMGAADVDELLGRMLEETYRAKLRSEGADHPGLLPELPTACAAWRQAASAISASQQLQAQAAQSQTGGIISAAGSSTLRGQQQASGVEASTPMGLPWPAAEADPWSASEGLIGSAPASLWLPGAASTPMWIRSAGSPWAGAVPAAGSALMPTQLAAPEPGQPAREGDCEVRISVGSFAGTPCPRLSQSHISDNGSSCTAHAEGAVSTSRIKQMHA